MSGPGDPPGRPVEEPLDAQERMNSYWNERAEVYDSHQQRPERRSVDQAAWSEVFTTALGALSGSRREARPPADPGTRSPAPQSSPVRPAPPGGGGGRSEEGALDVLDVGTGSGYLAFLLADLGHRVTGIDLAEGMLARAERRVAERRVTAPGTAGGDVPVPAFRRGDAVAPPFAPSSFDAVVNRYVVWTVRHPEAALRAWYELLRPAGMLVVVDGDWFPRGLGAGTNESFQHWYDDSVAERLPLAEGSSQERLPGLLHRAGFVDVRTQPLTQFLELDRRLGAAPGHHPTLQHLTTARRPPRGRSGR